MSTYARKKYHDLGKRQQRIRRERYIASRIAAARSVSSTVADPGPSILSTEIIKLEPPLNLTDSASSWDERPKWNVPKEKRYHTPSSSEEDKTQTRVAPSNNTLNAVLDNTHGIPSTLSASTSLRDAPAPCAQEQYPQQVQSQIYIVTHPPGHTQNYAPNPPPDYHPHNQPPVYTHTNAPRPFPSSAPCPGLEAQNVQQLPGVLSQSLASARETKAVVDHILTSLGEIKSEMGSLKASIEGLKSMVQEWVKEQSTGRRDVREKPPFLPFSSLEELQAFNQANETDYAKVVSYFAHVGGSSPKEAVNLCFKEGIKRNLAKSLCWPEELADTAKMPMRKSKFSSAIFDALVMNQTFRHPTRTEFERMMVNGLRTAKQRLRNYEKRQMAD